MIKIFEFVAFLKSQKIAQSLIEGEATMKLPRYKRQAALLPACVIC
jgi:hypothetical protein